MYISSICKITGYFIFKFLFFIYFIFFFSFISFPSNCFYGLILSKKNEILGNAYVGKTSIMKALQGKGIDKNHVSIPLANKNYEIKLKSGNRIIFYEESGFDVARISELVLPKTIKISDISVIFLVYSIDDEKSFKYIEENFEQLKNNLGTDNKVYFLIENKFDLEENRKVQKTDVQNFLDKEKDLEIFHISARNGYNIEKLRNRLDETLANILVSKKATETTGESGKPTDIAGTTNNKDANNEFTVCCKCKIQS